MISKSLLIKADVVIDFSFHSATLGVAKICAENKKPLIIGTTGHTAEEKSKSPKPLKAFRLFGQEIIQWE
jgi:4-hydroxy-tetrahydrodipicolinate reductase